LLGWQPRWSLDQALDKVIEWTLAYQKKEKMRQVCLGQLDEYSMITS
jgi:CDP-glucose 4,6-dehydratase